jgi:hypothetical protein
VQIFGSSGGEKRVAVVIAVARTVDKRLLDRDFVLMLSLVSSGIKLKLLLTMRSFARYA